MQTPLLLEGRVDDRDETILRLRTQLRESETARLTEQGRANAIEAGVRELRDSLAPLYRALRQMFGEIEAMGVGSTQGTQGAPVATNPRSSAAWDSWKQKLGANSAAARIIDFLMVHGELTHTQIRIHLGTNRMQTVYDAVSKLNRAGLLNKNGDKFSLKEL